MLWKRAPFGLSDDCRKILDIYGKVVAVSEGAKISESGFYVPASAFRSCDPDLDPMLGVNLALRMSCPEAWSIGSHVVDMLNRIAYEEMGPEDVNTPLREAIARVDAWVAERKRHYEQKRLANEALKTLRPTLKKLERSIEGLSAEHRMALSEAEPEFCQTWEALKRYGFTEKKSA